MGRILDLLDLFENKYPYTDFHELNLTWCIRTIIELSQKMTDFIKINQIKYADPIQWNITSQYEANTIVIDPGTGIAYLSTQAVPSGINISNTDYWTEVFSLQELFDAINQNLTLHVEDMGTTNATFNSSKGDWILIDQALYIALVDIIAGTTYIENTNIRRITVEEQTEHVYDPDTKNLKIHGKITPGGTIVSDGDYHIFTPSIETISIKHVNE